MSKATGFVDRVFKNLLCIGSELDLDLVRAAGGAHALDDLTHAARFQTQLAQHPACHAAFFFHQTQQQMLGTNTALLTPLGLLVRQAQHPPCTLGEAFHTSHGVLHSSTQINRIGSVGILPKSAG